MPNSSAKPSMPRVRSASLSRSQRARRSGDRYSTGSKRRRDRDDARHPLGLLQREAQARVGAHRDAGQHGALDLQRVEHRREVAVQVRIRVRVGRRGGRRAAVPAGVVGDHAMAAALQRARAHHDVAPRRGHAVQQDDGGPLPLVGHGQRHAVGSLDRSLGHAPKPCSRAVGLRRAAERLSTLSSHDRDRRQRGGFRDRRGAAIGRRAGRRRLLGALVRALPSARPDPREGRRGPRGQGRAGEDRHRREPGASPSSSASRASPPSRRSSTARSPPSSSARRARARSSCSSTASSRRRPSSCSTPATPTRCASCSRSSRPTPTRTSRSPRSSTPAVTPTPRWPGCATSAAASAPTASARGSSSSRPTESIRGSPRRSPSSTRTTARAGLDILLDELAASAPDERGPRAPAQGHRRRARRARRRAPARARVAPAPGRRAVLARARPRA